ncbi:hypothetical protein ABW19_dt0202661 [Dactylella cylindrospora]|nr:hypothetical protein ABW19_dt0202661 [Dactylella cylindrospora]
MSMSFGLKPGKPKDLKQSKPAQKPNAFSKPGLSVFGDTADDDSGDEDPTRSLNKKQVSDVRYGLQKPASSIIKRSGPGSLDKPSSSLFGKDPSLEEEDPSIYDYDTAWDNMKAAETRRKAAAEGDDRKPKYMQNLLAAAEVRERDRLRAKDRMLQKEREAEGEEFADKEKFVTGAYKKQQEEMRRLEEEEQKRQEEMNKKGGGISSFYKNMLNDTERQHEELVKATEAKDDPGFLISRSDEQKEKSAAQMAAELNKSAAGSIEVNDEGQVVDKRQLLGAGLNVKPKAPKPQDDPRNRQGKESYSRPANDYNANKARRDVRERQSRMIEQQLEERARKVERDEAVERAEVERQAKIRKTTAGDVNSARERYLQRKREAEEKKKAASGG